MHIPFMGKKYYINTTLIFACFTSETLIALCFGLSFQGYLQSTWPWEVAILFTSGAKCWFVYSLGRQRQQLLPEQRSSMCTVQYIGLLQRKVQACKTSILFKTAILGSSPIMQPTVYTTFSPLNVTCLNWGKEDQYN